MEQGLISDKTVAVIGGGPAGCICAKFLSDNGIDTTVFDKGKFLRTILPTGGGRCNLAHNEYDFKNLAQNYPRGEKFLYSVFSKFGTKQTIDFFKSIGIETYIQEDNRIFPQSNSSSDVKEKILKSLKCKFSQEEVLSISQNKSGFSIKTNKSSYYFDFVVISTGGHCDFDLIKNMGINIITPLPSLVGLVTEKDFSSIAGVSIKNVKTKIKKNTLTDDIIFTHKGISGPLIYKISSIYARENLPFTISLSFINPETDYQKLLNSNPHKEIKNLLSQFVPKSFAQYITESLEIDSTLPCHKIDGKTRDKIFNTLTNFEITVTDKAKDGEVVTCGGVDLKEVNSQTMESKKIKHLYFCGEVLDIDGFCGGFNLQNCWSTGYVAANTIINEIN